MLENTQKIYQLILETEKKFNDEKTKLVKRRETLQKKIDSKVFFQVQPKNVKQDMKSRKLIVHSRS